MYTINFFLKKETFTSKLGKLCVFLSSQFNLKFPMLRHVIKNFAPSAKSIPTKNKQLAQMAFRVVQTSQYQFSDQLRFIIRIAYMRDHYLKITLHTFSKTILQFRVLLIQLGFIRNKLQLLMFIFCSICGLYSVSNANRKGQCYNPIYSSFLKDSCY